MTFYDEWLATGDRLEQEMRRTMFVARDRDIPWERILRARYGQMGTQHAIGVESGAHLPNGQEASHQHRRPDEE